jgi:hypothetical protein
MRHPIDYGRVVLPDRPELYNVESDIGERLNVADRHPDIVRQLLARMDEHKADIDEHQDMLAIPLKDTP